jgi:TRAP-type C4-dicarboxylate transport system permease small subunit
MMLMPVGGALLLLATIESLWRAITGHVLTFTTSHGLPASEDTP